MDYLIPDVQAAIQELLLSLLIALYNLEMKKVEVCLNHYLNCQNMIKDFIKDFMPAKKMCFQNLNEVVDYHVLTHKYLKIKLSYYYYSLKIVMNL